MSNLSDIGFPVQSEQDVNQIIEDLLGVVQPTRFAQGAYYVYADPSGAEMYLQSNLGDELIGFNPHYAGKSRRKVGLTKAIERDSSELDGGFYAWANPLDASDAESGEYLFVFDAPNFRLNETGQLPRVCDIQLTAFASNDFQVYASEAEYLSSQNGESKLAAKSFAASALLGAVENIDEPPRPIGVLSGEIKSFALKRNERTNATFYWFLIETAGGAADVVADPKLIAHEPQIGGIVSGQFWLSGKILEERER